MLSRRATLLTLAIASIFLAGCSVEFGEGAAGGSFEPATPGTLTVATQPMPTAGFWEGTPSEPTGGLEYEMAVDMADRLGLDRVEIQTLPFSRIVGGDLAGADLAMALITPTEERDANLDFTTPYIDAAPALVVRDGTEVPDVQTAQELQFVVGRDTTFEEIVAEVIRPDSDPVSMESRQRELRAVRLGRADVAMFDLPAAEAIVNDDPLLSVAAQLPTSEPIAAALPQGSGNTDAVGTTLRAMENDGTIDDLSEEWLGRSLSESSGQVPLLRTGQ